MKSLTLLPYPRTITHASEECSLEDNKIIQLAVPKPHQILFTARILQTALRCHKQLTWSLNAAETLPLDQIGLKMEIQPDDVKHPQGYHLVIDPEMIRLRGYDPAGLFYGVQTLQQIISQSLHGRLPCMEVMDWPDYPVRGVMLDISRDRVYRLETLCLLVDDLAALKINQLQLYTEHTFAYQGHEIVWQDSSPLTAEDVIILDAYCQDRFIDLVPNQNSLGHMTRWLKHPAYQHLAETSHPVKTPWGHIQEEPFSLAPVLPESLTFIQGLYDQLLPNFSSRLVNVGCDEAFDIGAGLSRKVCEEKGKGKVYLEYLLQLHAHLEERDRTMQFWGDIILQFPELIPELPGDLIALDWGYEADHPFLTECQIFQDANIPFYVCPGTSSWNSIGGRADNALANINNAAQNGLLHHAQGILITDWGDNGHWQQLPIAYPGISHGAAIGWCLEANQDRDIEDGLNHLVFNDTAQVLGGTLLAIGNMYKAWGILLPNSSPLFWLLQNPADEILSFFPEELNRIQETLDILDDTQGKLSGLHLHRPDAATIKREMNMTIGLMRHACKRALWLKNKNTHTAKELLYEINGLLFDFQELWLQRSRPGGLRDSLAKFDTIREEYDSA